MSVRSGGARTAVLAASSGTQGARKTVMISYRNLVANLAQIRAVHRLDDGEVVLAVARLRHICGMQMAMNSALRAGVPIVIARSPVTARNVLDSIERYRITVAYLVPSVVAGLGSAEPVEASRLWLVVSDGAPLADSVAQSCPDALDVSVVQGVRHDRGGVDHLSPGTPQVPRSRWVCSCRTLSSGSSTRTPEPTSVTSRARCGFGPQVTPGYAGDSVATAALIDAGGWLHTGDLAVLDADGHLTIVGRMKALIKYKGHQAAPAEIEHILLSHPAIADVAVLGVSDLKAGELPKASWCGRFRPGVPLACRVAPHKQIRLIEAVPEIPRSSTGKVLRNPLLESGERLRDLNVAVSGGGRGLGRAFAEQFAGAQASVQVTRSVLPGMIARGAGRIITVVSNAGRNAMALCQRLLRVQGSIDQARREPGKELRGTGVAAFAFDPGLLDIGITRAHFDRERL